MVNPGGTIPGSIQVPLHIRVIGEKLALLVEGSIILIPEPSSNDLPGLSLGVNPRNVSNRSSCPLHKMLHGRQKLVLAPELRHAGVRIVDGKPRLVSHEYCEAFSIG